MKLTEATAMHSREDGEKIFWECVKNLNALGEEFTLTPDDFKFAGWFRATALQGQTRFYFDNEAKQEVTLNELMLREGLEDMLLNTIYHELIHVVVNKLMLTLGIVNFDRMKQHEDPVVNHEIFDPLQEAGGHEWKWLEYAAIANEKLGLRIPITPECSDKEVADLLAANDDIQPVIEIYCTQCGASQKFLTLNDKEIPAPVVLGIYADTKTKNENHACKKCQGTLYIKVEDEQLRQKLDVAVERYIGMRAFMRLFGVN